MPSSIRPSLIVSIVEIILAVSAGVRNDVQMTMWPRRTRVVIAARADNEVNDSKVISSVGRGIVWKWSKSQTDSNPSRSACWATAAVRLQEVVGSHPAYSPTQPCGTIAPIVILGLRSLQTNQSARAITDPGRPV